MVGGEVSSSHKHCHLWQKSQKPKTQNQAYLPLTFLYPKLILVDPGVGHAQRVKTSVLGHGAAKTAETRRCKRLLADTSDHYFCGTCEAEYE